MGKNIVNFSSKFFKMGKLIGMDVPNDFVKPENGYGFKVDSFNFMNAKVFIDGYIKKGLLLLL